MSKPRQTRKKVPSGSLAAKLRQSLKVLRAKQVELKKQNLALKESREKLRLSEEKFATAFRSSPDSININRLKDGVYLDINQGFTRMSGYTLEEVRGRSSEPGDLGIWVRQEDRDRLVAGLKKEGGVDGLEASSGARTELSSPA
jgi:PAS domain-containing protein